MLVYEGNGHPAIKNPSHNNHKFLYQAKTFSEVEQLLCMLSGQLVVVAVVGISLNDLGKPLLRIVKLVEHHTLF